MPYQPYGLKLRHVRDVRRGHVVGHDHEDVRAPVGAGADRPRLGAGGGQEEQQPDDRGEGGPSRHGANVHRV
jgi:hypothetical protein